MSTSGNIVRQQNTARLLYELERLKPISRTELAEVTGMSATSVTRIVNYLQSLGLVEEVNLSEASGRGRKAINLNTCPGGLYTAGFHADDHSFHSCLMDFSRRPVYECSAPLQEGKVSVQLFAECINSFLDETERRMPGIHSRITAAGLSIPGCIDAEHGTVVKSDSFGWKDERVCDRLTALTGLPVYIENDVRACLIREKRRLNPDECSTLAYIYTGTSGVGFAAADGGSIIRGAENAAGEIQEMSCGFGKNTGDFLLPSKLLEKAKLCCPGISSVSEIAEAAKTGAVWAEIIVNEYISGIRMLITVTDAFLNPGRIILGGDLADCFSDCLGDILTGHVIRGHEFERSCAFGAAEIAMDYAVSSLISRQEA